MSSQWGNLLTLQAASVDPILGGLVDKAVLRDLFEKTMGFLRLTAQPSSALTIDCKILEHVAERIGLVTRQGSTSGSVSGSGSSQAHGLNSSFSSNSGSGDVVMSNR